MKVFATSVRVTVNMTWALSCGQLRRTADSRTHGLADSQTCGLADSRTRTGWNALFFADTGHAQQFSNEPGTATGVVEEL